MWRLVAIGGDRLVLLVHAAILGRLPERNRPTGAGFSFAFAQRRPAHDRSMGGSPLREGERESCASWSVSLR
ncbi:MAG TPA: hypothetical protein DIW77_23585 [Chromatiaceae bacterium]|nr:hypothetical protein [Chromatiaceae bacterium]